LLEQLAGQYVLGTLRGRARRRFERIMADDSTARELVANWEDRLVSMLPQVKAETPAKQVWTDIEQRLGFTPRRTSALTTCIAWWRARPLTAALASVVVVALAVGISVKQFEARVQEIAVITRQQGGQWWHVRTQAGSDRLVIEATASVALDATHAYELWALPASGAAPVSLGLLPARGSKTLALNAAQQQALAVANKIAVSLEPLGGSPSGAPTGPVLSVAEVAKVG